MFLGGKFQVTGRLEKTKKLSPNNEERPESKLVPELGMVAHTRNPSKWGWGSNNYREFQLTWATVRCVTQS